MRKHVVWARCISPWEIQDDFFEKSIYLLELVDRNSFFILIKTQKCKKKIFFVLFSIEIYLYLLYIKINNKCLNPGTNV